MRWIAIVLCCCLGLLGCGGSGMPGVGSPAATGGTGVKSASVPIIAGCQIFPTNNWWNTDISKYPLDKLSDAYIKALPGNLHPDFGQNPDYGIPFNIVPSTQKKVPVTFYYGSQSDPGPYPIPPNAQIEGGPHSNGDRHVLVLQRGACKLYEMWRAFPVNHGASWRAGSGALFHLNSNKLRPDGWTSADAAGLPILPALVKCAEVQSGAIDHALRVTFAQTQQGFIHPATHYASNSRLKTLPPMGLRIRMKASYDIAHITGQSHVIAVAMKTYGMFVADNGSNWYFQGEGGSASSCWNDNDLNQLKSVPNTAFEVVYTGKILRLPGL
ncbi:MAG: hypothetical protein JO078_04180 [Candidatus Eremiobacteraeota bacterium]|nr:hypothetical protein [Candidatus Eremiobacteraeota bacterium]MBV9056092.1 hypothetical protein [Candidatus Eremiobacteraeota bacterium]MBV9699304.1 hypothetical protein [Candidatus Eremiobacteraeota bacterium]